MLMAAARVHNGMHYPSDVLTGTLLGVGYGLAAWTLLRRRFAAPAIPAESAADAATPSRVDEAA
jgi:membrane-associated phospholipid phosphatase